MKDLSYKRFFTTLGNENRLKIIRFLSKNGPNNVSLIVAGTNLEQTAVSHNLKRLLSCQFVHLKPNGKERVYSLNEETIKPLLTLMDEHVEKFCKKACEECIDHQFPRKGGVQNEERFRT